MSATLAVFHAPRAIPKLQRNNVVPRRRIGSPHQAEDPRRRAKRGDGKKRLGRPSDKSDDNGETSGRRQFLSGGLQLLILSSADDLLAAATAPDRHQDEALHESNEILESVYFAIYL